MNKIVLCSIQNVAHIFNVDDYMNIRTNHRIVGSPAGISVSCPRNSNLNSLPVVLNQYEVKLLLQEKIAVLVNKVGLKLKPSEEVKEEFKALKKQLAEEQQGDYIQMRLDQSKRMIDKIILGKRKKMMKKAVPEDEIKKKTSEDYVLTEIKEQLVESVSKNLFHQIPTEHPFPVEQTIIEDVEVDNPFKYRVFRDLWQKGKFITAGSSFGCDFLVYPGDPLYFHASHKVHIVNRDKTYDITYLTSTVRMSVIVNKMCVFALEDENGEIEYQTVAWEGNTKFFD